MTPVSYYAPGETTSPQWAFCFAKGCGGAMMPADFVLDPPAELYDGPVALFGSPPLWPLLRAARAAGRDWYYADHAYFGRRTYYRITRNAFQTDGRAPSTGDRFRAFGRAIAPWRTAGTHILVCPQSAAFCALHGFDVHAWLADVIATIRSVTTRPIVVRWKRQPRLRKRPIAEDLVNAWAVVVHSSAAALDALIAGIPVFVLAPFAAAARMGLADLTRIETPITPDDRAPFLWALADAQWTFRELMTGVAWRALQETAAC